MITAERLREVLEYDPNTGVFRWKVAVSKKTKPGQQAGCLCGDGYVRLRIDGALYLAHRLAWLHVNGDIWSGQIDHVNGERSDNRISNIRPTDSFGNARNTRGHKGSKSGRKGVHWDATGKKWGARICVNRRTIYLGNFDTIDQAAEAYRRAAITHHGAFARFE